MISTCKRGMAVLLTATMLAFSTGSSNATLAPATITADTTLRAQDIQTVQTFLEQKEVAQKLTELKLTSSEIESRLGNLSNQELHQVASKIQHENLGRDGGGVVVTILVIGILALLFVYLLKRV